VIESPKTKKEKKRRNSTNKNILFIFKKARNLCFFA